MLIVLTTVFMAIMLIGAVAGWLILGGTGGAWIGAGAAFISLVASIWIMGRPPEDCRDSPKGPP